MLREVIPVKTRNTIYWVGFQPESSRIIIVLELR